VPENRSFPALSDRRVTGFRDSLKVAIIGTVQAAILASIFRDGVPFLLSIAMRFIHTRTYTMEKPDF